MYPPKDINALITSSIMILVPMLIFEYNVPTCLLKDHNSPLAVCM